MILFALGVIAGILISILAVGALWMKVVAALLLVALIVLLFLLSQWSPL